MSGLPRGEGEERGPKGRVGSAGAPRGSSRESSARLAGYLRRPVRPQTMPSGRGPSAFLYPRRHHPCLRGVTPQDLLSLNCLDSCLGKLVLEQLSLWWKSDSREERLDEEKQGACGKAGSKRSYPAMMEQRPGTDQVQPSFKQDGTGTSHNTDLSLFPHLATINSSAEISAVSVRPRARLDLWKQHLLCSVAISA